MHLLLCLFSKAAVKPEGENIQNPGQQLIEGNLLH